MPGNPLATVYVGNLDDSVDERILYEIMVQAGPLVDVYMPRDRETKRHKGYAFAEYTSEASARYAVDLFSGCVFLKKKLLRFQISVQDKLMSTHERHRLEGLSNSPVEPVYSRNMSFPPHSPFGSHAPFAVENGFWGSRERLSFSPLSHAQAYNSRLVSLGHHGLGSRIRNQENLYLQ